MHTNDEKYGFLKQWFLQLTPAANMTPEAWLKQGIRAWNLLQDLPEGEVEIPQKELFKHSPKY